MSELNITILQLFATIFMSLEYLKVNVYSKKVDRIVQNALLNQKVLANINYINNKQQVLKNKFRNNFILIIAAVFMILSTYMLLNIIKYHLIDFVGILVLIITLSLFFFLRFLILKIEYLTHIIQVKLLSIIDNITILLSRKSYLAGFGLVLLVFSFVIKILKELDCTFDILEMVITSLSTILYVIVFIFFTSVYQNRTQLKKLKR